MEEGDWLIQRNQNSCFLSLCCCFSHCSCSCPVFSLDSRKFSRQLKGLNKHKVQNPIKSMSYFLLLEILENVGICIKWRTDQSFEVKAGKGRGQMGSKFSYKIAKLGIPEVMEPFCVLNINKYPVTWQYSFVRRRLWVKQSKGYMESACYFLQLYVSLQLSQNKKFNKNIK